METSRSAEVQFLLHPGPRRPRGSEIDAGRSPRVTQVLALALSFQDMIASGNARNYRDLANRAEVTAERLSQVMKLLWLAPAIQEEILYLPGCSGRYPLTQHPDTARVGGCHAQGFVDHRPRFARADSP